MGRKGAEEYFAIDTCVSSVFFSLRSKSHVILEGTVLFSRLASEQEILHIHVLLAERTAEHLATTFLG